VSNKTIEKLQLELKDTLESLCRTDDGGKTIEVVAAGSRHDDVRLMFRVYDEPKWLRVVNAFLIEEKDAGWYSFVGKKYLLKDGKLVYAWNIVLESPNLDETVQKVRKILMKADDSSEAPKKNEVVDVPDSNVQLPERMQNRVRAVKAR